MGRLVFDYQVGIESSPADVFAYVADLTKHGEWSDGLNVEAVGEGDVAVGSEYRSVGKQLGKDVENRIQITEYDPPNRFAFTASDGKTEFTQEIKVSASGSGTLLERRLIFNASAILSILFKVMIGPLVANPSMNKSLKRLKANLETAA